MLGSSLKIVTFCFVFVFGCQHIRHCGEGVSTSIHFENMYPENKADHHRPASETKLRICFNGGPMMPNTEGWPVGL